MLGIKFSIIWYRKKNEVTILLPSVITVAVFRPLRAVYDYEIEEHLDIRAGMLVQVPLGRASVKAIVVKGPHQPEKNLPYRLKKIQRLYPPEYTLPESLLELGRWMSEYYMAPLGEILQSICPSSVLQKTVEGEAGCTKVLSCGHELTDNQKRVISEIKSSSPTKPVLLHGVTGSGKTEVYLHFIEEMLRHGQSCLYLVPEITLTRETMRKLEKRFSPILVVHSQMTDKGRREVWLQAARGGPYLVVGARSALFSPLENIGLIVIDEEHDTSFKQDNSPRYQCRDVAIIRALSEGSRVILGSATPSLESYQNALQGKYMLVQLKERVLKNPLPKVRVVDIKAERQELKRKGAIHFSRALIEQTKKTISNKRQVIFFLNRRGFSTVMLCADCGQKVECPHCSIPLTYYRKRHLGICHYCGFESIPDKVCPTCERGQLLFKGTGTEKLHQLVEDYFENIDIIRVDGSQDGEKNTQDKLSAFMEGEGHLLLGTQMISKGLDSPRIQLSAALNADIGLSLPDFRAAEKDFQLLTQLAGRAGRGHEPGECIFQTSSPDHYAIRHSITQNYEAFFYEESQYRKKYRYPPFCRLARFVFSSSNKEKLMRSLLQQMPVIRQFAAASETELLGPAPAPIEKIKTKFRWHLIAKSSSAGKLTWFLQQSVAHFERVKPLNMSLDRDPQNMM